MGIGVCDDEERGMGTRRAGSHRRIPILVSTKARIVPIKSRFSNCRSKPDMSALLLAGHASKLNCGRSFRLLVFAGSSAPSLCAVLGAVLGAVLAVVRVLSHDSARSIF
eukprot:2387564-Rhodomonas_salina.2